MHTDRIGNHAQIERLQIGHAMAQKTVLLTHDLLRDLQYGSRPLIEAAHQPVRRLHTVRQKGFFLRLHRCADFGIIFIIDDEPRHRGRIQFDKPAAIARRRDERVGHDGIDHRNLEQRSRRDRASEFR